MLGRLLSGLAIVAVIVTSIASPASAYRGSGRDQTPPPEIPQQTSDPNSGR